MLQTRKFKSGQEKSVVTEWWFPWNGKEWTRRTYWSAGNVSQLDAEAVTQTYTYGKSHRAIDLRSVPSVYVRDHSVQK